MLAEDNGFDAINNRQVLENTKWRQEAEVTLLFFPEQLLSSRITSLLKHEPAADYHDYRHDNGYRDDDGQCEKCYREGPRA